MIYFIEVSYNGVYFKGSQVQGDLPTVQGLLNKALSMILRTPVETYGASRTDEGVHARMNVYHFLYEEGLDGNLKYRLNGILPQHLCVNAVYSSDSESKNCRFDALARRYRYYLHFQKSPFLYQRSYFFPYAVDTAVLEETSRTLMTYTHFATFSKRNTQSRTDICHISESFWERTEDGLVYTVTANRFLRGMVRALVGTQLQVARGKYDTAEFRRRAEALDCRLADFSVPGHGLYLEKILYPDGYYAQL